MCGIAGIFAYDELSDSVDQPELIRIRDYMTTRGPDGFGEWYSSDKRVGLAHRRLSIIDLSENASQPMKSVDGGLTVTFNGEIYNYRALRAGLEAHGCVFRTNSDTEVLLHLYRMRGPAMVGDLRGMFAFGLWDNQRRRLLLARDPYGIKPLYYADDGRVLRFASSVKALLASGHISREPDAAGVIGFYVFGSVPEPFTTWRAVQAVPAGSTITIDSNGRGEPVCYFSIPFAHREAEARAEALQPAQIEEQFREALLDSVRHHLVADVPVGAFLSAGIDSASLVGLMRDAGQTEINTVTLAFDEFEGTSTDEAPLAEIIAKRYHTHHVTRRIGLAEFRHDLPAIMAAMDQPSIDGINTWFVSKVAHELGLKVVISGIGGDELLGGYTTFQSVPRCVARFDLASRLPGLGFVWRRSINAACDLGVKLHPKLAGLVAYGGSVAGAYLLQRGLFLPDELRRVLDDSDMVREGLARLKPLARIGEVLHNGPRSGFGKVAALESCFYLRNQLLRDTDWAGMAHSLEIRTPLVDHELLRQVAPLIVNRGHPGGKALLAGTPSLKLPGQITDRRKTGFSIPVRAWANQMADGSSSSIEPNERLWSRTWARRVMSMQAIKPNASENAPVTALSA